MDSALIKESNVEKEQEHLEYLMDCLEEISKLSEARKEFDPLLESYTNTKKCALFKSILLYLGKHHLTSGYLQTTLNMMLVSIEIDLDFFKTLYSRVKSLEKSKLEIVEDLLYIIFTREIHSQSMRLTLLFLMLVSIAEIMAKRTETKAKEIEVLKKQGEKLKEIIDKRIKESEEKTSRYVI